MAKTNKAKGLAEKLGKLRSFVRGKNIRYKGENMYIEVYPFAAGGFRLDLKDEMGMQYATCNVHVPGLAEDELAIRNSEQSEGMYVALLSADVIHPYHRIQPSGFIDLLVCRLKL